MLDIIQIFTLVFVVVTTILAMRLSICLPMFNFKSKSNRKRRKPLSTMIVFGSGGHTAEMIKLIRNLSSLYYSPFYFVVAQSDISSLNSVNSAKLSFISNSKWFKIYRSREVF